MSELQTPEQPVKGLPSIEQRMQTTQKLAANLEVPVPERFKNDPHFWYLTMRDYWTQRKRIPETMELKLDRETNLGKVRKLAIKNAVEYASQYALLEKEAATDGLTGAFNRRALDKYLMTLFGKRRNNSVDTLVMIDVDNFKNFNSKYGTHTIGDATLKEIVRVIQNNIRGTDFLARYGGDELFLVMPDTNTKQEDWQKILMQRVDSIRQAIADQVRKEVEKKTGTTIYEPITISCGVGFFDNHVVVMDERGLENIYKITSGRANMAKQARRNIIVGPDGLFKRIEVKRYPESMAGTFSLMSQGAPTGANSYLIEMLGYEGHVGDLTKLGFDPDLYKKLFNQMGPDGIISSVETQLISRDGSIFPVIITGIKTEDEAKDGLLCAVQTIILDEEGKPQPKPNTNISCCAGCEAVKKGDESFVRTKIPKGKLSETLLQKGVELSHGICGPCAKLHGYPDISH